MRSLRRGPKWSTARRRPGLSRRRWVLSLWGGLALAAGLPAGCVGSDRTPPPVPGGAASRYVVDSALSSVGFSIEHRGRPLRGGFTAISGAFTPPLGSDRPGGLYAAVGAGSVETRNGLRDAHLRTADYFDVRAHPTVAFVSDDVRGVPGSRDLRAKGVLTLLGVSRPLTVTLARADGDGTGPSHVCTFSLVRSEFGLVGGLTQGVGDRVELQVTLVWRPS